MKQYLFFRAEKKISKKVAGDNYCGCVRIPQRFLVIAKLGRVAPATL